MSGNHKGSRSYPSESPAAVASAPSEEPEHDQQDRRADERHDDRAEDRVAGDRDLEVKNSGEHDAAEQRPQDPDDEVAQQPHPVTGDEMAREEPGHHAHQDPEQDRVP